MSIPAQRTIEPKEVRNFGRFGDAVEVPPLTDVQTQLVRPIPAARRAARKARRRPASKACCAKSSRSRATTRSSASNTCATSWASRATTRTNAGSCA